MSPRLPPEMATLVRCVGATVDAGEGADAAGLDWERVADLAEVHGVTPLLRDGLDELPEDPVPAPVRAQVAERARSTATRNLQLVNELHGVLDALGEADVRALPFKGPVLAAFAYGDLSRRSYMDLDLLVHPEDARRAVDRLEALGYEWAEGTPRRDDAVLLGGPVTLPIVNEYGLRRAGVDLEVRTGVGEPQVPFAVEFEQLWERRQHVAVGGRELPALAPEDRLLVLAYHGTKHRWHLLKWACDFEAALAATDPDWPALLARARRRNLERRLLLGVALVEALFDPSVPAVVRRRVELDAELGTLADRVLAGYAAGEPVRPSARQRAGFLFRASDSLADRARVLLFATALHPSLPEYRRLPLPGSLHPLYYLLRPARLAYQRVRELVSGGFSWQ